MANLGIALLSGREFDPAAERVARAVTVLRKAVRLVGDDATERGRRLTNLGIALSERSLRRGNPGDLEKAIDAYQAAIAAPGPDSLPEPSRLVNLGTGLAERYARHGRPGDLNRAASLIAQALAMHPQDTTDTVAWTANLALVLRDRYVRDGDLTDLDEAVEKLTVAIDLAPAVARERPGLLDQLATTLRIRAQRRSDADELHHAVELHRQAAQETTRVTAKCLALNNLAGSLRAWAAATGELGTIDEAVRTYRESLNHAGSTEERCAVLTNLGSGLLDRYDITHGSHDLDEAINALGESVSRTDATSPELPARLNNLGNGRRRRFQRSGRPKHARTAMKTYARACELAEDVVNEAGLRSALSWGNLASRLGAWAQAAKAHDAARAAADRLLAQNVTRRDKEAWLGAVVDLAAQAAYSHWRNDDPDAAVVWLEWGRARLLSHVLDRDRRDLADLANDHADLVRRFRTAAACVRALENTDLRPSHMLNGRWQPKVAL